ncbi:MAG: hypothetical protein LBQ73_06515 [Tannerellaceae bacterium]|nr:hypothetical protein [Tannerellaceae bacterium]
MSKKWSGVIFDNYYIISQLAEETTIKSGFLVKAYINTKQYEVGRKATDEFMRTMPVIFGLKFPKWNYKFSCS